MAAKLSPGTNIAERERGIVGMSFNALKSRLTFEPNETSIECAIREVKEETGLEINQSKLTNLFQIDTNAFYYYINIKQVDVTIQSSIEDKNEKQKIKEDNLQITIKDYYFSNVIARASKTMHECHNSKLEKKLTGTDN